MEFEYGIDFYLDLMHNFYASNKEMLSKFDTVCKQEIAVIEKWLSEDYVTDKRIKFMLQRQRNLTIFDLYYKKGLSVKDVAKETGYTRQQVYNIRKEIYAQIFYIE